MSNPTPQDIVSTAVDFIPVAEAGLSLIVKIVQMIEQAKMAKDEQHDDIIARFKAAEDSLASAAADAHQALDDELAKDAAAELAAKSSPTG